MSYREEYDNACRDASSFWLEQARALPWFRAPSTGLTQSDQGREQWFSDAKMNSCYMAVDAHVDAGNGGRTALIVDSAMTGEIQHYSYADLQSEVAIAAGMLLRLGVQRGDRVVIYMPMIAHALISMLACARIGAVHSVVFGGFAAPELAARIDDAGAEVVLSASHGLEPGRRVDYKPLLDEAIKLCRQKVRHCVVVQRAQPGAETGVGQKDTSEATPEAKLIGPRDISWEDAISGVAPAECVSVNGSDPLYILYTSGTTGKPKGVVRENAGHAVALHYSMAAIYNMQVGDVFWAASDVGWVVGHSYVVYAPLFKGCTSVLYEGKPVATPDAGAFWRVIQQHKVNALFSAPTAFRAIRKEDPDAVLLSSYDLSSLKAIFSAGERLDPPTLAWLHASTGKPVVDHWWQTETGWAIAALPTGLDNLASRPGSSGLASPGYKVRILDDCGQVLGDNKQGHIALELPLPPSCLNTIWNDHSRYEQAYTSAFPGYYNSGDGGYIDADGYIYVMGRLDDVINVAGHRLSTGEMEEVLCSHAAVAEAAVVARSDQLKGHIPVGLVVLKSGGSQSAELSDELCQLVRKQIGPVASFKEVHILSRLPKTRSGKTLRKTLRSIINGEPYKVPPTIDDAGSLAQIERQLSAINN